MSAIVAALQNVPFNHALEIVHLGVLIGKEQCQVISDLPFTDLWAENGWTGWWMEKDFNGDSYIEPHEGFDLVRVCGAIASEYEFAQTLVQLAF